jgi:hypothetical protein
MTDSFNYIIAKNSPRELGLITDPFREIQYINEQQQFLAKFSNEANSIFKLFLPNRSCYPSHCKCSGTASLSYKYKISTVIYIIMYTNMYIGYHLLFNICKEINAFKYFHLSHMCSKVGF